MFKVFAHKGFQIIFENGYEVSVMFGNGNYCAKRYDEECALFTPTKVGMCHESADAEIAVFAPPNRTEMIAPPGFDSPQGWVNTDDLAKIIAWAQALPPLG